MSDILIIALLPIFIIIVIVLFILIKRLEQVQSDIREKTKQADTIQTNRPKPTQTEISSSPTTTPEPTKPFFALPHVPENARPEKVAEIYSKLPGVIATLFSDRFGQPVAFETQFESQIDKTSLSASLVETLQTKPKISLGIGKEMRKAIWGEKSFWIITTLGGFPSGVWFEGSVPVGEAVKLVKELEKSLAKSLKNYYKMLW